MKYSHSIATLLYYDGNAKIEPEFSKIKMIWFDLFMARNKNRFKDYEALKSDD